jgi:dolichol-phosphate mannosyltransferase
MSKILIIIPTLNENKNIDILVKKIISLKINLTILVIDDNSTDGTRKKIVTCCKKNKFFNYIFRS